MAPAGLPSRWGRIVCESKLLILESIALLPLSPSQKPPGRMQSIGAFASVSRPVRQALALDTLKSRRRPFPVSEAEIGAVIVPELKLVQIPLQMLLAAKAISALH